MIGLCRRLTVLVLGTLGVVLVLPAQGQETGERRVMLEEIVVTAQRRAERLQDVPVAVSALSNSDIENRHLVNLQHIGDFVPNLYIEEALGSVSTPKAFMRGIGVDNQVFSFDTPIGFYVDGVYFARVTGALVDMFDIERIEVLRGPQSVLYGRNSSVGAIRVVTQDPNLSEFEFMADATTGSKDRANARMTVNVPLAQDKAGMRLSLSTRNADGWMKDVTNGDRRMNEDVDSGRVTFQFVPSDRLDLFLRADFLDDQSDVRAGSNFLINPDDDIYTFERTPEAEIENSVEAWGTSLTAEWNLGDWSVTSISAYRELKYRNADDVDGRADVRSFEVERQDLDEWQVSQELFVAGDQIAGRPANWVAGVYYFHEDNEINWALRIFAPPTTQFFQQETDTAAVYAQVTWPLSDQLSVTGGARYTDETKDMEAVQFFPDGTLNPDFLFVDDITANKVTWRVSLDYKLNDEQLFYASAATGFRSGGFNGSARDQASILSGSFGTEDSLSYEVGSKGDYLDGKLRVNAAYFYAEYTDLQLAITRTDGTITTSNVEATVHGLELEAQARPTENLDLSLTLGTMTDDIKRSDLELKNTPDLQYRLGAEYRIPLAGRGNIRFGADYSWTDDSFNDTSNRPFTNTGTYHYLDARLGWRSQDDHWAVTLIGRNLTDEFVNIHTFNIADGFISSVHFPNYPRRWELNLRYRY